MAFRHVFRSLVPSQFYTGDGEKILHTLAMMKDAWVERLRLGLEARFPRRAGPSALALTGSDRGIFQGRTEVQSHYAERLVAWRYPRGHRVRGSAFALLNQVSEYFGGIRCWTIDAKGNYHKRTASGDESFTYGNDWDWDGAGATPRWGRFWLVLEPPIEGLEEHPDFGDPDLWGGDLGLPGYTVGQLGITPDDSQAMRRLMRAPAWKPAGVRAEWLIVNLDGSDQTPDGTWLHWSRNDGALPSLQVPTRYEGWRFISLNPDYNNTYAGDPDNFPEAYTAVGGGTYAGDPDNFPATITLSDGSTYAGDPDSFPASFRLVDDGDPPV